MNKKVSFSIWYVFLAVWAVILLHDFFPALNCEVRRIIDEQYARVKRLLAAKQSTLHEGAKMLLEREAITGPELKAILDMG